MPTYETTIMISSNAEKVWELLSNVAVWHTWLPTITSVKPLDGDPLKVGSRFAIVQPKLQPATWTATLVDAPRQFIWESRVPGVVTVGDHIIEETQPGQVKVTLKITFSGFLSGLIGWLYGSLTKNYLEQEAKTLKSKVEGAA